MRYDCPDCPDFFSFLPKVYDKHQLIVHGNETPTPAVEVATTKIRPYIAPITQVGDVSKDECRRCKQPFIQWRMNTVLCETCTKEIIVDYRERHPNGAVYDNEKKIVHTWLAQQLRAKTTELYCARCNELFSKWRRGRTNLCQGCWDWVIAQYRAKYPWRSEKPDHEIIRNYRAVQRQRRYEALKSG